jgi:predicted transcriptional regulator
MMWAPSRASLTQVLNEDNLALLRPNGERHPNSVTELAALSGRAVSNLSRTLSTMESYGLAEIVECGRAKAPRLACDHVEIVMPALAHNVAAE